jgi:lipoic acid synthetase
MLGLGESPEEALQVMRDLRAHGVSILTVGQYLRPSPRHLPIVRYVPPEEFAEFRRAGREMGFRHVESGPLVRSSYHADRAAGSGAGC